MVNNPFSVVLEAMNEGVRNEEELINRAAQKSAPPSMDFRPPVPTMPQNGVAKMKMGAPRGPTSVLTKQSPYQMVPPMHMTQGESRTKPRIGDHLLGGG